MATDHQSRAGFKKTEIGWIPEDWNCPQLGSDEYSVLQMVRNGLSIKQNRQSGDYKVTRIETISNSIINEKKVQFISDISFNTVQTYLIHKGDILFSHINSEAHLGKTAIAKMNYPDLLHGMNLLLFRVNSNILIPEFLNFLFIFYRQLGVFRKYSSRAVSQSSINQEIIKSITIPLPPISEQQKIAEILSTWDRAIERVEKLIEAKQRLKKGLMQQLLTGQMRFREFGEPVKKRGKLLDGWKQLIFGDIASLSNQYLDPKSRVENIHCIELEHISQKTGKIIGFTDPHQQKIPKKIFYPGDVLFGKLRPYLKKFAYCDFSGVCSSEIWVLKAKQLCEPKYLFLLIQNDAFISAALKTTGTKMPRADWKVVSNTVFYIPSREEQKRISEIFDKLEQQINNLENFLNQLQFQKHGLMQKLLTGKVRVRISK